MVDFFIFLYCSMEDWSKGTTEEDWRNEAKENKFENKKRKEIWTGSGSRKKGNNNEKKNSYEKKDGLGNFVQQNYKKIPLLLCFGLENVRRILFYYIFETLISPRDLGNATKAAGATTTK